MGFDLVQGFLFAKPVTARKFVETCWAASQACLPPPPSLSRTELRFAAPAEPASAPRLEPVGFRAVETGNDNRPDGTASGHNTLEGLVHRDERILK
jgi:hypothetical protein